MGESAATNRKAQIRRREIVLLGSAADLMAGLSSRLAVADAVCFRCFMARGQSLSFQQRISESFDYLKVRQSLFIHCQAQPRCFIVEVEVTILRLRLALEAIPEQFLSHFHI